MDAKCRRYPPRRALVGTDRLNLLCGKQSPTAQCGEIIRILLHGLHVFALFLNKLISGLTDSQAADHPCSHLRVAPLGVSRKRATWFTACFAFAKIR